jgi:hypothetical protein
MHDAVRAELIDLVRTGERNLCAMPGVLATMLREGCPDSPDGVREVVAALDCGLVDRMLLHVGPICTDSLAVTLTDSTELTLERARWVIESWILALDAADKPQATSGTWSEWNKLSVETGGSGRRTVFGLGYSAAAGALGGCVAASVGGAMLRPNSFPDLPAWFGILAHIVLASLGCATGGLVGWMAATSGTRFGRTDSRSSSGRPSISCLGAGLGGCFGTLAGLTAFGPAGVTFAGMAGAFAGEVLAFDLAEVISRFRK